MEINSDVSFEPVIFVVIAHEGLIDLLQFRGHGPLHQRQVLKVAGIYQVVDADDESFFESG